MQPSHASCLVKRHISLWTFWELLSLMDFFPIPTFLPLTFALHCNYQQFCKVMQVHVLPHDNNINSKWSNIWFGKEMSIVKIKNIDLIWSPWLLLLPACAAARFVSLHTISLLPLHTSWHHYIWNKRNRHCIIHIHNMACVLKMAKTL